MTGTLDWGNDRSAEHWNYVYITTKSQLLEPVKKEFYELWSQFSSDLESIRVKHLLSDCTDLSSNSSGSRNSTIVNDGTGQSSHDLVLTPEVE